MWRFGFCLICIEVTYASQQILAAPWSLRDLRRLGGREPGLTCAGAGKRAALLGRVPCSQRILRHIWGGASLLAVPFPSSQTAHALYFHISAGRMEEVEKRMDICKSFFNYRESLQHLKYLSCL